MVASYHVYHDQGLLYVRYDGHHSTRQINDLVPYYRLDPHVRAGLHIVVDCSRLVSVQVDVDERRQQMRVLYDLLKYPADALSITYFCPNTVGQDLTRLQKALWQEFADVELNIATSLEELAQALRQSEAFIQAMIG